MGVFQTVYDNIARLAGDAWGFMVGLLIIVAMLGGLYYTLQGGAGMAFGGSKMAGMAIIGIVSLVVLVLVALRVEVGRLEMARHPAGDDVVVFDDQDLRHAATP